MLGHRIGQTEKGHNRIRHQMFIWSIKFQPKYKMTQGLSNIHISGLRHSQLATFYTIISQTVVTTTETYDEIEKCLNYSQTLASAVFLKVLGTHRWQNPENVKHRKTVKYWLL